MRHLFMWRQEWIPFLAVFFLLVSCAPKTFVSFSPPKTSYKVLLNFDPIVPEVVQDNITLEFQNFITASASKPVQFVETNFRDDADLLVNVKMFKPVTPGQSAAGVFVSLLGLSLPVVMAAAESPFYVAFWYFPKSQSISEIYFKQGDQLPYINYRLRGPGFLQSEEKQLQKHSRAYKDLFLLLQRQYEKDLKKHLKTQ